MLDNTLHMTVPTPLKKLVEKNIDWHELQSNKVVLHPFKANRFNVESEGKAVITDTELYKCMADNFQWLLDHLANENEYERAGSKFTTKIGHMLGVTSHYLTQEASFNENQTDTNQTDMYEPDLSVQIKIGEKPEWRSPEPSEVKERTQLKDSKKGRKTGLANEVDFDFTTITGDFRVFDNLKKILGSIPNPPDFTRTLVYQHMKPRNGPMPDTTAIEKMMFRNLFDRKLGNALRSAFEKSSLEEYVKLVKHFSPSPLKIGRGCFKSMLTWKAWLLNGFHLVFAGRGSNRNVLNAFSKIALRDGHKLTINAYAIKGSDTYLWNFLNSKIVGTKSTHKADALAKIARKVESLTCAFYIVIYGVDHFMLNDGFSTLRGLLQLKNVKVVGTIDRAHCGPVLNELEAKLGRLRRVDTNTGENYTFAPTLTPLRQELISSWQNNPPNFLVNKKAQKTAAQIHSILEALSQNHQKLFSLLAQIQMEQAQENRKFIGIEKNSILSDARAITICHNESKLDNLLTEFTTHDVVEQTRGPGGRLFLKIPFDSDQLDQFVG